MSLLSWETLQGHLERGIPFTLSMGGQKGVRFVCDPATQLVCLRLPESLDANIAGLSFAELEVGLRLDSGNTVLDIRLQNSGLFPNFYQLSRAITEYYEDHDIDAVGALRTAVQGWRSLILNEPLLSQDEQLGLAGELTFLVGLIMRSGSSAVRSWTATDHAAPGRHDFRFDDIEIEVKATRQRQRLHHINGLGQLLPTSGCRLYVLSLKYEDGGTLRTQSLPDLVAQLRLLLTTDVGALHAFEEKLSATKYRDKDAPHYNKRLLMVDAPALIEVTDRFPRITTVELAAVLTDELIAKLQNVSYVVNLEGLGWPSGSPKFEKILGGVRIDRF
jgi:hypothetical protein